MSAIFDPITFAYGVWVGIALVHLFALALCKAASDRDDAAMAAPDGGNPTPVPSGAAFGVSPGPRPSASCRSPQLRAGNGDTPPFDPAA